MAEQIIEVKEGVYYHTEKTYDEQSDDFKEYVMNIYEDIPKMPYPEFDAKGDIAYLASNDLFEFKFVRIQRVKFSKMNRSLERLDVLINMKGEQ